ncbi:MAG: class I SAM-dependent methyltransferase [Proteobacteria bacterium]|nr:MAG: class I SAM-dependent methyltransferase [Pseudomonadota bacterium]
MKSFVERVLKQPAIAGVARTAMDWVDLQFTYVVDGLARYAPRARGKLLDVGCGDKPYEYLFTPHVDEYIGVEYSSTYELTAAGARNKADVLYDGEKLPFEDASFDTVINVQVLEHTPHPQRLLSEIGRVLKPGGVLILSAPFSFRLHEEPHDYFRYSPHGMRELMGNAGISIEEIHPQGGLWSLVAHKLNSYMALNMARVGQMAQVTGKCGHEKTADAPTRAWLLPFIAPAMVVNATGARILDRFLPDPTETMGFTVLARRNSTG